MTAVIVWRNPMPPANNGSSIERITSDNCGAVYAVSKSECRLKFELILGMVVAQESRPFQS